jgi:uncharacterized heparinase superfamily protein
VQEATGLPAAHSSQAFAESGFYFFSSPRVRGSIRCGPLGVRGWSNHAHNDQLSFEFVVDGRAVLVDPGLPCYSGDREARNLFRSTRSHNTCEVAEAEQNRFWHALLLRIVDDTQSHAECWHADAGATRFVGSHSGYLRLPQRVLVRRELQLTSDDVLTVRDILEFAGPASHTKVRWFFHLASEIRPEPIDATEEARLALDTQPSRWLLGPAILSVQSCAALQGLEARVSEGAIAPRFGQKMSAPVLEFQANLTGRAEVLFTFTPAKHPEAALPCRVLP